MAERELIAAITAALSERPGRVERGPGDDAAVVRAGQFAVTTIDALADGSHFSLATHSPADIGHKALAGALSDLAAMGAAPGEVYVALALSDSLEESAALELVAAMDDLATRTGTTIAGGDVIAAATLQVTVSATGWAASSEALVYRDGARPGDRVGVTGRLGGSAAGRLLLADPAPGLDAERAERLRRRHLRPEPLLDTGTALAAAGAGAMIDVSDGVATDADHLAAASGVALRLELSLLPLDDGVEEVARAGSLDPRALAATGGEDYELLLTAPPQRAAELERAAGETGTTITWIGEAHAASGIELVDESGEPRPLAGFEHSWERSP